MYVVITDFKHIISDGPSFMQLYKGDLIVLTENNIGETLQYNSWGEGVNDRSGEAGNFPTDCVQIVPSVRPPPPFVINILKDGASVVARNPGFQTIQRMKLYTLESYAEQNFRIAAKRTTISRVSHPTSCFCTFFFRFHILLLPFYFLGNFSLSKTGAFRRTLATFKGTSQETASSKTFGRRSVVCPGMHRFYLHPQVYG